MALAGQLGCPLVVLCSREARAVNVGKLAAAIGVDVAAADLDGPIATLPRAQASDLLRSTGFMTVSDLSVKRNVLLALSRLAGWERILLLDDDITEVDPADVRSAAGLLDSYDAVGLDNRGYPDNSVVCHIYRELGGNQKQFIGAGGLAVATGRVRSMFPDVYNEDWLFLVGGHEPLQAATAGSMSQKEFDPFDPQRAWDEEFGDSISEGLYWLLDEGRSIAEAEVDFWREFLQHRRAFLRQLMRRLRAHALHSEHRRRQLACLRAARAACQKITPELCAEYLARWRADLATWREFIDQLPTGLSVSEALAELGLSAVTTAAPDGCGGGRAEGHAPAH